jgi:multiple sugar transport system substrate-binding protein
MKHPIQPSASAVHDTTVSPPTRRRLMQAAMVSAAASSMAAFAASSRAARTEPAGTLTVAAYPAVDAIIKAALPRYRAIHPDVEVRVVSRQFVDHHTAMTTALSTSVQMPDLMALEVGYVGRFAQGAGLEDLSQPPFDAQALTAQWVGYAADQGRDARGRILAVPTDIGPGTLLYRRDLVTRAGLDEAALTASWSGYVEAGRRIKAATGAYLLAHAREMKDILIRIGVQPGQGLYFDAQSRVLVDSPRFRRAFELARDVRSARLDARVSAWTNEWSTGLRRGGLATQMTGAWLAGHLNNWLAPDTRGLWRAAALPEGAFAAYGGTFLALPRRAAPQRKALAWDLIRLLTLDRQAQLDAFKAQDAFPALLSAHDDPFFDEPIGFLGGQPARRLWRDTARRITAVRVHKQDAFADEVINTELDKVLDRGKDIASALGDAAHLLARRAHR